METIDDQAAQLGFSPPLHHQPAETKKSFSFTNHQLIIISVVSGLVLLSFFGLEATQLWSQDPFMYEMYQDIYDYDPIL
jgi:hypothetical protein